MSKQQNDRPTASSMKSQVSVAVFTGILMMIAVVAMAYANVEKRKHIESVRVPPTLETETEREYREAMEELAYLRTAQHESDELLVAQRTELDARGKEIAALLKDREQSEKVREELENLRTELKKHKILLAQATAENDKLATDTRQLSEEREELLGSLQNQITRNGQLEEVKAVYGRRMDELLRTAQAGSVIRVKEIDVKGFKVRNDGQLKPRKSARKTDQLQVCFTTLVNDVVKPGKEQFYVRIVNPRGETLAIENRGSGYIELINSTGKVRFTNSAGVLYENAEQELCLNWHPQSTIIPGTYEVEIYNKGYLAGSGQFELK